MKKKLILIAAMALSAMSYAVINDTVNVTAKFVQPATIVKIGADPVLDITYDSRNGGTDLPAGVGKFSDTPMQLQAANGVIAGVSTIKNISLTSSGNDIVSAEVSLVGTTFTSTESGGNVYYEGTMPASGIEDFNVVIECKNLATELPKTGEYTGAMIITGYLN